MIQKRLNIIPDKEKDVLKDILEYLQYRPGKYWRMNCGAAKLKGFWVFFGKKGQADITGIRNGQRIEIETKKPKGYKYSTEQIEYEQMITEHGGLYIRANCLEDVINAGL